MKILANTTMLSESSSTWSRDQLCELAEKCSSVNSSSFYIADLEHVLQRICLWNRHMPNVKPIYPLKYNSDSKLMKLLSTEGFGFSVSSKKDIEQLANLKLLSRDVMMTMPCRLNSQLKSASANKIGILTFDSESELSKIAKFHPEAKLLLRISTKDDTEWGDRAHGATSHERRTLFAAAAQLGLNIVGVAFDGVRDGKEYFNVISECRYLFEQGRAYNFPMNIIDIGSVDNCDHDSFLMKTECIQIAIEQFFVHEDICVQAHLDKFIVKNAYSLITQVTSVTKQNQMNIYSINDSIYQSFDLNHNNKFPENISENSHLETNSSRSMIMGSSGDELDLLAKEGFMPQIEVGSLLAWHNMGNILTKTPIIYHQANSAILKRIRTESFSEVQKCQEIEVEC